ncbi:MAG: hypothetical protein GF341_09020 [candidate division Zixibacteria bacterium]|nr:hypothetical protein [candidate division Zixibacteria bacterium]
MSSPERRYEKVYLLDEGVSDMLNVNPRTLRREVVDTICVREVKRAEMSTQLVRCAPSVFTEAHHSWYNVVMFGGWSEIIPVVELKLREPYPRRHALVDSGWLKDLITCVHLDCPVLAHTVTAETSAVEMITDRDERIVLHNEWCSGCN